MTQKVGLGSGYNRHGPRRGLANRLGTQNSIRVPPQETAVFNKVLQLLRRELVLPSGRRGRTGVWRVSEGVMCALQACTAHCNHGTRIEVTCLRGLRPRERRPSRASFTQRSA